MRIKVEDLDNTIKAKILDIIREQSLMEYRTLPMASDTDAIRAIVEKAKDKCVKAIQEYYRVFSERDIECVISTEDYIKIYRREI